MSDVTIGFNKELVFTDSSSIPNLSSHQGASIYTGSPKEEKYRLNLDGISTSIFSDLSITPVTSGRIEITADHTGINSAYVLQMNFVKFSIYVDKLTDEYKILAFNNDFVSLPMSGASDTIFISWDSVSNTSTVGFKNSPASYITAPMTWEFGFSLRLASNYGATGDFFEGSLYDFKTWTNTEGQGTPDQRFYIDDQQDELANTGAIGSSFCRIKNKTSSFWGLFIKPRVIDKEFLLTSSSNIEGEARYVGNWSPAFGYGDRVFFNYKQSLGDYRDVENVPMLDLDFRIVNCDGEAPVLSIIQKTIPSNASISNIVFKDISYTGNYSGSQFDRGGDVKIIEDITNSAITYASDSNNLIIVNPVNGSYIPNVDKAADDLNLSAYMDVTYTNAIDEALFCSYSIRGDRTTDYNTLIPAAGSLLENIVANMDAMIAGDPTPDDPVTHALYSSLTDDPLAPTAVLNTSSMYSAYDFSGCSFMYYNVNQGGRWETGIDHTMVSARISLSSDHSKALIGEQVIYRQRSGIFQTVTVVDQIIINNGTDSVTVSLFDQDVLDVSIFKLPPIDLPEFLPTSFRKESSPYNPEFILPTFTMGTVDLLNVDVSNTYGAWGIIRSCSVGGSQSFYHDIWSCNLPQYVDYTNTVHGGSDSSCPVFILADVGSGPEPLVIGFAYFINSFEDTYRFIPEIQAAIETMAPGLGYSATIADLSAYTRY